MSKARPLEWLGYQSNSPKPQGDLSSMSIAEIEELAGATAVALLKTAHEREAEAQERAKTTIAAAMAEAERVRADAEKFAQTTTGTAQKSATTLIASANETAEKTLKAAEKQSAEILSDAQKQADDLMVRTQADSMRRRAEVEKQAQATNRQMQGAITKFSDVVQQQLQLIRQIGLKATQMEAELLASRDAIIEVGAQVFDNDDAEEKRG